VGNGSGVSRGDRNRNARLARLRALVPVSNAIVGIDLAEEKQMVVVTDHDSKVLARKTFKCHAWNLGTALDWATKQAASKGSRRPQSLANRQVTGGGCSANWPTNAGCPSSVCSRC
jgi:hypothetical protein